MRVDLDTTIRELARRVLGYCILRTGDPGLAEDVAQESLAALVSRWRRHGPPDAPDAFVFAIARRRAARALLRQRLWLSLDRARAQPSDKPDVEASLIERSERDRVIAALSRLPRRDRDLLLLLTAGELPLNQAAGVLGISLSAAKMRAHRARARLRALLEDDRVSPR